MPGWSFAQNGHPQFRKDAIKSLNMMGNDPQSTGYVVSNHFLTPWPLLYHSEYLKLEIFDKRAIFHPLSSRLFSRPSDIPQRHGGQQNKAYLYPDTTYNCHYMA